MVSVIRAYGTRRAIDRKTHAGNVRHAVDELSHLCGALDTACGRAVVVVELGPWDPDHPGNCVRCMAALMEHPEEMTA